MIKIIIITLLAFSLIGCFLFGERIKKTKNDLDKRDIQYYTNKTMTSLEVPPDLTKPNSKNTFKLSEYVENIQEEGAINFSKGNIANKKTVSIVSSSAKVKVERLGQIRWIVVDKKVDAVWNLAKSFLKSHGFSIKRSDKRIGVMETNFLENYSKIPDQSESFIRSMLKKTIETRHTLPIIDKYRVRVEPIDSGKKTEVYFTLNSMEEVITKVDGKDENTIWQARPKDQSLETEMLYRFMIYLGSDYVIAREQITDTKRKQVIKVEIVKEIGGYTKLKFALDKYETWENIGWALDELNIDVTDKDVKEGSFYVNLAKEKDKDILSGIFDDDAIKGSYQIIVKRISSNVTEVYIHNLSKEHKKKAIDFSYELLSNIAKQFQ